MSSGVVYGKLQAREYIFVFSKIVLDIAENFIYDEITMSDIISLGIDKYGNPIPQRIQLEHGKFEQYRGILVKETEKAILIEVESRLQFNIGHSFGYHAWIPKSIIIGLRSDLKDGIITGALPAWFQLSLRCPSMTWHQLALPKKGILLDTGGKIR